jgi:hypothetical protein
VEHTGSYLSTYKKLCHVSFGAGTFDVLNWECIRCHVLNRECIRYHAELGVLTAILETLAWFAICLGVHFGVMC